MLLIPALLLLGLSGAIAECDPPFEVVEEGCYLYSPDIFVASYDTAEQICVDQGGDLAVVKSGDENRAIIAQLLGSHVEGLRVLLGARINEIGQFEWIDGTLVRDGFDSWATLQPSGNGDCMGYSSSHDLYWDDFPCDNYTDSSWLIGFLCEKPYQPNSTTTTPGPSSTTTSTPATTTSFECPEGFDDLGTGCYHISSEIMVWPDGPAYCESLDSHMAYIKSEEEQLVIENYLDENIESSDAFIGGFDLYSNDTFYWLDGTALEDGYTNWADGQPGGGSEDGLWLIRPTWEWGDSLLTAPDYILCEIDL